MIKYHPIDGDYVQLRSGKTGVAKIIVGDTDHIFVSFRRHPEQNRTVDLDDVERAWDCTVGTQGRPSFERKS